MTYQELIANIRDLGFSDDAEIEEFGELVPNSINRAITEINLEVSPIIERYEFDILSDYEDPETKEKVKGDSGLLYITMPDIDDNFLDFAETPVKIKSGRTRKVYNEETREYEIVEEETYLRFSDFEIEASDTLVIDQDENKGTFRIFYKVAHNLYDGSQFAEEMPLPKKVHHLVPLLASYYIWLEDEPTKAAQYYNLYEQKKADLTVNAKPRMRVLSGGI